jgi:hypothetical protein
MKAARSLAGGSSSGDHRLVEIDGPGATARKRLGKATPPLEFLHQSTPARSSTRRAPGSGEPAGQLHLIHATFDGGDQHHLAAPVSREQPGFSA